MSPPGRVATVNRFGGVTSGFNPNNIADILALDPANSTMGSTPTATGTTPPVVTFSGTLTTPFGIRIEIQTTGVLGASTFRVSLNNGTSYVASSVATVATYVIPGTAVTVNFPAGTYTNDNVYVATVATGRDLSPTTKNVTQASAAAQPTFRSANTSFNNNPSWDWPNADNLLFLDTATFTAITPPMTYVFVLASSDSASGSFRVVIDSPSGNRHNAQIRQPGVGATAFAFTWRSSTSVTIPIPGPGNPIIIMVSIDGTGVTTFWVNGTFCGQQSTGALAVTQWRIGGLNTGVGSAQGWRGSIGDIRVIGHAVTLAERRNIFSYFGTKHNIPVALST